MSNASLTTIAATTIPERTGTAGGITSFVPLTTVYTANPICGNVFVKYPTPNNHFGLMGWDPSYGEKVDSFYDCNPSIVSRWFTQSTNSGGKAGDCAMAVSSGQILTYASATASSHYHTFTTTMMSQSTVGAIAITGWNVNYVRNVASSTSTSTSTSDNTTSDATSAGIVVGVIAGVSLLAMALFIFIRRRRKQYKETTPEADSSQAMQPEELHGQDLPHEMDQANMVAELSTEHETRYELDGQEDSEEKNK
ncbi:hypothetical protein N7509_002105 [Penicillium cosmopolitanum]|uniref:Uncharacterized protein n=1 Tax=Penicillium cosmopolitanum TaxID=1131564 RepID=A0A9X0BCZ7_9EURO|nr:uncharacterized protein N7509_002105 [Penicillium cosmopolitanum]KAJ5408222.1 hypothetical protein N7509_002105 [Penicillium cosmopolitanum]